MMLPVASGTFLTRRLIAHEFLGPNAVHPQLIRWLRKPKWLGTAKTKIFRVPKRPVIPIEETVEIQRLFNNYRTYRESIRKFYMKVSEDNNLQFNEELLIQQEALDFEQCSKLNDEWNKEIAKNREIRLAKQMEKRKKEVLEKLKSKAERDKKIMEEVEEKVRKAKAEAVTFISEKNIDEAIEKALGGIVDFNSAIDKTGTQYTGKYNPSEKKIAEEKTV